MAEMHAEATPFFFPPSVPGGENTGTVDSSEDDIFCAEIPLYPQIDALSEIDRRRRNECSSVTQRHATRTLWDHSSGILWLPLLFKAQRVSCSCYSNFEGSQKICTYLRVAQKLSLILLLPLFWRTTSVFNDAAWIFSFFSSFQPKKLEIIFIPPLYLRCHPCISTESFVLHVKSFTARRQCCCMCAAQIRLMGGRGSAELTIKGSAVIHSPITGRSTPSLRTHMTTMAHFSSLSDRYV